MSFEGRKKQKIENSDAFENKSEKKISLSEIDELLKESEKVSDNLDKSFKDDFYKKENFEDSRVTVDKLDDKFDEEAYAKAGFWKKFENFTRFGLHKERYNLIKSKDRGLLDKTKINEDVLGKGFKIGQGNNQEREYLESNVIDIRGDFKKDKSERETVKAFGIDEVDGRIIKIVGSGRTEKGQIEAAGKMREAEISRLETVNGAELVGLKEAMERSAKSKESFLKLGESMSGEEREKVTAKLNEEESQTKEKIKEKEEKLAEETKKFRDPFEGRLQETLEIENSLMEAFDFIKTGELNLNKQIKECELFIKEAQKLDLLGGVGSDVVKIFEGKKVLLDAQAKEFAERKELVSSKLEALKNNRREIYNNLFRINAIGKTKEEKDKEIKEAQDYYENKIKNKSETKTKSTKNKKSGTESADIKKDKDDEREEKTWDETRDEAWGLKNTAGKTESRKAGKTFDELFPSHDYPGGKKENEGMEDKEKINQSEAEEEIETEEGEEVSEKIFTKEEIEEIATKELKDLGVMNIKDKIMREQIINNVIMAVETMIEKSKKPLEEEDIKKEVGDWYRKYSKNYFKKGKQSKI